MPKCGGADNKWVLELGWLIERGREVRGLRPGDGGLEAEDY